MKKRRIFGGNSGYVGYSKSCRAVDAENRGLRSKSQMDSCFLREVNDILTKYGLRVTLKEIRLHLDSIDPDEWHHTSIYGNKTSYYSSSSIAAYFKIVCYYRKKTI